MTDIVHKPKSFEIADSLLEMAQDVEIGHADRLGVPAASFLRESADCISRQADEIERLRAAIRETLYMDDRGHVACRFYPSKNLADIAPVLAEVLEK